MNDVEAIAALRTAIIDFRKNNLNVCDENLRLLKEIIQFYKNTSDDSRDKMRQKIIQSEHQILLLVYDCCAGVAINRKDSDMLHIAIALHSIENFKLDPRENIIRFSILWYISEELEVDPNYLFHNVTSFSSQRGAKYFNEFASRPRKMKSLKVMGISVIDNGSNVSFLTNTLREKRL